MKSFVKGLSLAAVLLLAVTAFAQDKKDPNVKPAVGAGDVKEEPGVHRMEIYNGPNRSIQYIYRGLSASEAQAVRELERAENEGILSDDLLALRKQYISGERTFEAQRRFTQEQLYGYSSQDNGSVSYNSYRRVGEFGRIGSFANGWCGAGFGYGGYGMGGVGLAGGFTSTDSAGLGQGVGDEGVLKNELAKIVAAQATPEYAAKVSQNLTAAMNRAANSAVVRDNLKIKGGDILPVEGSSLKVTRVLEGKAETIEGKLVSQEGDWLILDTAAGKRRLLKTTVVDVLEMK